MHWSRPHPVCNACIRKSPCPTEQIINLKNVWNSPSAKVQQKTVMRLATVAEEGAQASWAESLIHVIFQVLIKRVV